MSQTDFSRIAVIGSPGSGKTTFSEKLSKVLGKRVTHLDKLLWESNWVMMPFEKRKEIHDMLIGGEEWLIDGMWRSHLADRLERATTVIFLDYPTSVCMRRAARRHFKNRGKQRPDIAEGCLERSDRDFTEYIRNFRRDVRPFVLDRILRLPKSVTVVTFANPREAKKYLESVKREIVSK
ncbi:MAG: AAA family ATPase [Corallococcus sp.]|nr:AAA family ATPase [Corallococcus sp.]